MEQEGLWGSAFQLSLVFQLLVPAYNQFFLSLASPTCSTSIFQSVAHKPTSDLAQRGVSRCCSLLDAGAGKRGAEPGTRGQLGLRCEKAVSHPFCAWGQRKWQGLSEGKGMNGRQGITIIYPDSHASTHVRLPTLSSLLVRTRVPHLGALD